MTDELQLLRQHRGEPSPPGEDERLAARRALAKAIQREVLGAHRSVDGPSRGGSIRRARRLGFALATSVAVLVLVGSFLRAGSSTGPALAAPAVLDRLARIAASQGGQRPGPGQYLYTATRSLTSSDTQIHGNLTCEAQFLQYRRNWVSANGEGLFTESDGPAHYPSRSDASRCRALPQAGAEARGTSYTWAAPGCLSIDPIPLDNLPRDPATLRARLLTGKVEGGPPGPAEAFTQVGDLLRETDAPPTLRAALYRAAAGLPGVKFLGNVTDRSGRRGLGLALDSHGTRHELIFSAQTSALLSEQGVLIGHAPGVDAPLGTVLYWSTYTAGRIADRLPVRSPLPLAPRCVKSAATVRTVPEHPQDSVLVGVSRSSAKPVP